MVSSQSMCPKGWDHEITDYSVLTLANAPIPKLKMYNKMSESALVLKKNCFIGPCNFEICIIILYFQEQNTYIDLNPHNQFRYRLKTKYFVSLTSYIDIYMCVYIYRYIYIYI